MMRSLPNVTLHLMEDILMGRGQLKRCYNADFFDPLYSKIVISLCNNVIEVKELATSLG